jgi:hypothetical protein
MGIKTVVNLRSFHSDRNEIGETALVYEHIYMKAWHAEDKALVRFLQTVTDPVRTVNGGLVCAGRIIRPRSRQCCLPAVLREV